MEFRKLLTVWGKKWLILLNLKIPLPYVTGEKSKNREVHGTLEMYRLDNLNRAFQSLRVWAGDLLKYNSHTAHDVPLKIDKWPTSITLAPTGFKVATSNTYQADNADPTPLHLNVPPREILSPPNCDLL